MNYSKILLCGLRNTGKTSVFWQLQKELGWPTFSTSQFLRDYVRTHGLQRAQPEELGKHDDLMRHEINYRVDTLLQADSKVIIEARVLEQIDKVYSSCFKVLLTASDEVRVKRNAFRESISLIKSSQKLIQKENKWLEKVAQQFGRDDFFNPRFYNLVIKTDDLTVGQVVAQIRNHLET